MFKNAQNCRFLHLCEIPRSHTVGDQSAARKWRGTMNFCSRRRLYSYCEARENILTNHHFGRCMGWEREERRMGKHSLWIAENRAFCFHNERKDNETSFPLKMVSLDYSLEHFHPPACSKVALKQSIFTYISLPFMMSKRIKWCPTVIIVKKFASIRILIPPSLLPA